VRNNGFLAQIRARIIPNYTNQGGLVSVAATTPEQQERLRSLLEETTRRNTADELQSELRSLNHDVAFPLLHSVPKKLLKDAQFVKAVSSAAHLTAQEMEKFKEQADAP
jgi:hypothetical protein